MKRTATLTLYLILGVAIAGCSSQPATEPPIPTEPAASPAQQGANLGEALNLVNGTPSRPSVFSSYHIDVSLTQPMLSDDGKSVVAEAK